MKRDLFEKPKMVKEAAKAQKGMVWILELLVFVAVYLACNIAMLFVMFPTQFFLLFTKTDYLQALKTNDVDLAMEASLSVAGMDGYMIVMLLAEILMILVACLFCKLLQKRKMSTMGFVKKGFIKEYLIGLIAGFAVFSAAVLLGVVSGALKIEGFNPNVSVGMLILYFIGFMIQGMAEEVLCRGYFCVSYARRYPMYAAIIANSLIFAALHLMNSGITVLSFINLVLFGIFASVYFIRRGNIWGIGAFHSIWNFAQGNFFGIKVSGMNLDSSVLTTTAYEGKELLNGGDFGLEGSIWVTLVLIVSTVIVYFWKKKPEAEEAGM